MLNSFQPTTHVLSKPDSINHKHPQVRTTKSGLHGPHKSIFNLKQIDNVKSAANVNPTVM